MKREDEDYPVTVAEKPCYCKDPSVRQHAELAILPASAFFRVRSPAQRTGLQTWCRECKRIYKRLSR